MCCSERGRADDRGEYQFSTISNKISQKARQAPMTSDRRTDASRAIRRLDHPWHWGVPSIMLGSVLLMSLLMAMLRVVSEIQNSLAVNRVENNIGPVSYKIWTGMWRILAHLAYRPSQRAGRMKPLSGIAATGTGVIIAKTRLRQQALRPDSMPARAGAAS